VVQTVNGSALVGNGAASSISDAVSLPSRGVSRPSLFVGCRGLKLTRAIKWRPACDIASTPRYSSRSARHQEGRSSRTLLDRESTASTPPGSNALSAGRTKASKPPPSGKSPPSTAIALAGRSLLSLLVQSFCPCSFRASSRLRYPVSRGGIHSRSPSSPAAGDRGLSSASQKASDGHFALSRSDGCASNMQCQSLAVHSTSTCSHRRAGCLFIYPDQVTTLPACGRHATL